MGAPMEPSWEQGVTHKQHRYLRLSIVLLLYPFDRPILAWLTRRTYERTERLSAQLLGLNIPPSIEVKEMSVGESRARLKRMQRERLADSTPKRAWRATDYIPLDFAHGSSLVVNSPLIACPICERGQVKADTSPCMFGGWDAIFSCSHCKHKSLLSLRHEDLRLGRIEAQVIDHIQKHWINHDKTKCECLECASSISPGGYISPTLARIAHEYDKSEYEFDLINSSYNKEAL